jgi:hypothetical protein
MPDQKAFRKGIGKSWWITFDILDVMEPTRPYLNASLRENDAMASLLCLRVTEYTALIVLPVIKKGMEAKKNVFERVCLVRHWVREKWIWFDEMAEKTEIYLV